MEVETPLGKLEILNVARSQFDARHVKLSGGVVGKMTVLVARTNRHPTPPAVYSLFVEVPPHFRPEPHETHVAVLAPADAKPPLEGRKFQVAGIGAPSEHTIASVILGRNGVHKLLLAGGGRARAFEFGPQRQLSVYMTANK